MKQEVANDSRRLLFKAIANLFSVAELVNCHFSVKLSRADCEIEENV